ncbi:AAA family ATPase [Nocardia sp. NPDC050408]|uniref:AAA family ATPase n=1 Tax=unclassified Nocardia TaxID=2637762 RepID=UPI0034254ADC
MDGDGELSGQLVVLRGDSGAGKSSVAREVQRGFAKGRCAVVGQDVIRRTILRERDEPDAFNVTLIETIATACLDHCAVVVVEGILDADRYGRMLERLQHRAFRSHFYAWDLAFEETARRHHTRPQAAEFTVADMRSWYRGWQPLPFVDELRMGADWSLHATARRIRSDLLCKPRPEALERN